MSTPSDFAPDNGPRREYPSQEQRDAPRAAPTDAADSGPGRRVRIPSTPPPQAGPGPADERRRPSLPQTGPALQPPPGAQHAGNSQRPQFSWPDAATAPRPHTAHQEPAAEWRAPVEETDEQTSVLPPFDGAHMRDQGGHNQHDQGVGGFFTDDAAPAEASPQDSWAPAQSPGLVSGPRQAAIDAFATGTGSYGGADDRQRVVTSRRRPAGKGWRRVVTRMTGGLVRPGLSVRQEQAEELHRRIKGALLDVYVVAFVNAKGGVGKTTMTVAAGSAIARERGDRVIAVDVDTDLGNLSSRFDQQGGAEANIEALSSLKDASSYPTVRVFTVQNDDRLEMLGSQNDPRSSYTLNSQDFEAAMKILKLHYNVIFLDCGTAITSPLFSTIAKYVDSLVVVASQDPAGLNGAWATLGWLQAHGFGRLLPRTVVALNATVKGKPLVDINAAETQFREKVQSLSLVRVPYDVHLAEGGDIAFTELKPRTRKALMSLAGAVAQHYPARQPHRHHTDETGRF
jgi:MinD-like ATPase involved in chromosome partitioning or flagellar assembly